MSALVPTSINSSLRKSSVVDGGSASSYAVAFLRVVWLLGRLFVLLALLGVLVAGILAWFWLASFRMGSRLGSWLLDPTNNDSDKLTFNVLFGSIVTLLLPLAAFGSWSERLISERFQIQFPPKIDDLRAIAEEKLGLKFAENFPFLPAKVETKK